MEVDIRGIQPQTLIDYPGNISTIVFTGGCNMRCPFCHNFELATEPEKFERIPEDDVIAYLDERKGFIDGVVITGGEPTLWMPALKEFIERIKEKTGLLVKLDSNGLNPQALKELFPVIDYIAMDVKAAEKHYSDAAGVQVDMSKIRESIRRIMGSGVEYEFRTTVVPAYIPRDEFGDVVSLIEGANNYFLQQYTAMKKEGPLSKVYEPKILNEFAEIAKPKVKKVSIRGV